MGETNQQNQKQNNNKNLKQKWYQNGRQLRKMSQLKSVDTDMKG